MSRRPIILVDVDGPLTTGFFEASCEALQELGIDASPDQIDRWEIFQAFGASPQIEARARQVLCRPGVASSFKPRPGSLEFIKHLQEQGADVRAVTAPLDDSPTWAYERELWLVEHFGFSPAEVVLARDKSLIRGDVLIDDRESTLKAWTATHPSGLAILWGEPHNRSSTWRPRAGGYGQLLAWIEAVR